MADFMTLLSFKLRNRVRIDSGNTVHFGNNNRIRKCIVDIHGAGNTLIFKDGANLRGVHLELIGNNCTLTIGKNCVIGEECYFSCREKGTNLTIGDNCMFSRNVKLMTSDGHDVSQNGIRINPAENIEIGSRVWLADNVTVLKGCCIASGSIVGINSIVTKNIPSNSVAVGCPAKVVKSEISWDEKLTF
ncbi:hexapeptide transferase [Veronia nyctiphanis]|uniref:Hexapeptide transferase n=1 Tax=Veronia nyctiphanis TaxID=1278244 RepID=A0A4V1LT03_9GAMM|nr:acyltransferase [Veronia nyctiphanis]RXJ73498.1 hexapeptide transferase [Veronia nyctiphanis]